MIWRFFDNNCLRDLKSDIGLQHFHFKLMTFSAKTRNVCNYKVYKKGVEQIIQILDTMNVLRAKSSKYLKLKDKTSKYLFQSQNCVILSTCFKFPFLCCLDNILYEDCHKKNV